VVLKIFIFQARGKNENKTNKDIFLIFRRPDKV